ncbi:unnamed protein product, partial [Onchocerca ochengi]|uniref:ABC transporter permease n=1 Tax=Onchocerca ochengi TaxID=42157 RepID=A0A182EEX4_ONCOC
MFILTAFWRETWLSLRRFGGKHGYPYGVLARNMVILTVFWWETFLSLCYLGSKYVYPYEKIKKK